jgi:hypothetical protein
MRKPLAIVLTLCVGALSVGCEPATKPVEPKVPKSDLGAPAKSDGAKSDATKPDATKTTPAPPTTTPAKP